MKLRLGNKTIKFSDVKRVRRIGGRVAVITLTNGDSLKVVCGVSVPETGFSCFPGTYDDLKSLIERLKREATLFF